MSGVRVGDLYAQMRLDDAQFRRGVGRAQGAAGKLMTAVKVGAAAAAAAIIGISIQASRMAVSFEKDMANVGTLLGREGSDRVNELSDDIKRLAMETGKPLNDLAGGLYQVVSAFGDTEDSAEILEIAAQAASAGLSTTEEAVTLLSGVTKAYGDTSADAVRQVSDMAFQTVRLGQTTFPELAASLGRVTPLAATLGVTTEELFGTFATLTGVTGGAAEVSTQMAAILKAMMSPTNAMADAIAELGYETAESMLESEGMVGALRSLMETTDGTSEGMSELFGRAEALTAVFAVTGAQADTFDEKFGAMSESMGASAEAFEIQQATVAAMWDRTKQSLSVIMVEIGERFLPMLGEVLGWFLERMPQILGSVDAVMGGITDTVSTGIGWVQNLFAQLDVSTDERFDSIRESISGVLNAIMDIIGQFVTWGKMYWDAYGEYLLAQARVIWDMILGVIDGVFGAIHGVFEFFAGLLTGDWERMGEGLLMIWDGLWGAVKSIAVGAWTILTNFLDDQRARMIDAWESLWARFEAVVKSPVNAIIGFVNNMIGGLEGGINSVINGMNSFIRTTNRMISTLNRIPGVNLPTVGELSTVSMPRIPTMDTGGLVEGPGLFAVGAGVKEIVRDHNPGGGHTFNININANTEDGGRAAARGFIHEINRRGFKLQGVVT